VEWNYMIIKVVMNNFWRVAKAKCRTQSLTDTAPCSHSLVRCWRTSSVLRICNHLQPQQSINYNLSFVSAPRICNHLQPQQSINCNLSFVFVPRICNHLQPKQSIDYNLSFVSVLRICTHL